MPSPEVTVIVPCYNEEGGLGHLIERIDAMCESGLESWRFLFVDDGSSDQTLNLLVRAAAHRPWIQLVHHDENLGLGAALRTAFSQCNSPIVCTIDSDCTYPPERLVELAALVADGADIATASAWHPHSGLPEGNAMRIRLSRMVSSAYKVLIGQDVYTFTCLFRAYRRELIESIPFHTNGFAAVAEIMLRAMIDGADVREVPMPLEKRRYGESKLKVGDAVAAHVGLLTMTSALVGTRRIRGRWTDSNHHPSDSEAA